MNEPGNEAPRLYHTMRCMDAEAMIVWLKDVLGFTERVVYRRDGTIVHAELAIGSSILMLGGHRTDDYAKRVGDIGGRRTDAVYLAVDDPDALYKKVSGIRRSNRDGTPHHRLWQPRFLGTRSRGWPLEFRRLLAKGRRKAATGLNQACRC